jgi:hypothetical protein
MKQNPSRQTLAALLLLIATLACVLPGQAIQPGPITNPDGVQTAIAGTAQAAQTQTQQALITSTPTSSPTATCTPTPRVSNVGTYLENLEDGSTRFTDSVAGVQMVFPAQWLAVRVGEQEFYDAWGKPEMQHPRFLDVFRSIQNLDPKIFRLTAFDIRPDRLLYNDITRVSVVFEQGNTKTLKELKKDEINNHPPYKGYKVLSSQTFTTAQGLEALNIEIRAKSSNGASVTGWAYRRRVMFSVPGGSMALDLIIVMDKKDLTMPDFDQVLNSIVLITP